MCHSAHKLSVLESAIMLNPKNCKYFCAYEALLMFISNWNTFWKKCYIKEWIEYFPCDIFNQIIKVFVYKEMK